MFRRSIDICADASNSAFGGLEARDAKVSDLYRLTIGRQQKVLWFYVAMDNAALVCMSEAGADLFEIFKRPFNRQRFLAAKLSQIATTEIFQNQIMKRGTVQIYRGSMVQTTDDVRVSHSIKRDRFILKVLNQ